MPDLRSCRQPPTKLIYLPMFRPPSRIIHQPCSLLPGVLVPRRAAHIPSAFLLDNYIPRYKLLTDAQISRKKEQAIENLRKCNICPRMCNVNRLAGETGYCMVGEKAKVSTIAPHFGEEPCIQGTYGSGSFFFSGCSLRCSFCQNHDISHQRAGFDLSPDELADWFVKLQNLGNVHNINAVTPEHVVPQVALAILAAIPMGLRIPIVYNTSSYDSPEALSLMDGLVDIYLADFKLSSPASSKRLLKAEDYPKTARESIKIMHRQVGDLKFNFDGIAQTGLLVRHLVMPTYVEEGKEIMRYLAEHVSKDTYVHVMEQYRPAAHVGKMNRGKSGGMRYSEINRPVTDPEVDAVKLAAREAGLWRFVEESPHEGFR
ncbi:hypothetical protein TWF225_000854 [Orbilia oligospora]|nr:hypothetical protein TWF225_000854 [Orbilia oligospora]KAF3239157.1 hypothetical protein TWF128_011861 [Orbilia oligospora]KAF3246025.1 hypothetical protein TWF217_010010 [Orbilia oligospora]